ncbi:unnamed protein product [Psylliodes chrysocephalus]|uniref:Uncharacterized protein n=1 Tax=Psylliodes chrysocephalus TaxID=3402493 RepID=A0A9P0CQ28_9CUCU|nr:unnamed protein product [Psylliodes chrysocephala]
MLSCANNLKRALIVLYDNSESLLSLRMFNTEWEIIQKPCSYLKPFKTLSTLLEGDQYCTPLPIVVIEINMLLDKLEQWALDLDVKEHRNEIDENSFLLYNHHAANLPNIISVPTGCIVL